MILVREINNVWDPDSRTCVEVRPHEGWTAEDYRPDTCPPGASYVIFNGRVLRDEQIALALPRDGDELIYVRETGHFAFAVLIPAIWASLPAIVQFLVIAVALQGLSFLVQLLLTPGTGGEADTVNSFQPIHNTTQDGTTIPVVMGEHRQGGHLISYHTRTTKNGDTRIWALYAVSEGRIEALQGVTGGTAGEEDNIKWNDARINGIEIDDNPIINFRGVRVHFRAGEIGQSAIPGFQATHSTQAVNLPLVQPLDAQGGAAGGPGPWANYVTASEVDAAELKFRHPNGLFSTTSQGTLDGYQVVYEIRYRPVGGAAWTYIKDQAANPDVDDYVHSATPGIPIEVRRRIASEFFSAFRVEFTERGKYEIECRKHNSALKNVAVRTGAGRQTFPVTYEWQLVPDGDRFGDKPPKRNNAIELQAVDEILDEKITHAGLALVAVTAIATEQLSGLLPNITFPIKGVWCHVWDGVDPVAPVFAMKWTRNPAWHALEWCLNERWGGGKFWGVADMQLEDFKSWADHNDALVSDGAAGQHARCEHGRVFDQQMDVWKGLIEICQTARAMPLMFGGRVGIKVEKTRSRVQLFTMGNIVRDSFKVRYLNPKKQPNAVEVQYRDRDTNWVNGTELVEDAQATTDGEKQRIKTLSLYGIDRRAQANREAYLAMSLLRGATRVIEFDAGLDAVALQPGDRFGFSHDLVSWGEGGRAMVGGSLTTVVLDRPVTIAAGSYEVLVRHGDDTIETRTVASAPGSYARGATLSVTAGFDSVPAEGEVYTVGPNASVVRDYIAGEITTTPDLRRHVVGVTYPGDAVYTLADGFVLGTGPPILNYLPTTSTIPPAVVGIVALERERVGNDGSLHAGIEAFWNWADGMGQRLATVYVRESVERDWTTVGTTEETSFFLSDLVPGTLYELAVCATALSGARCDPHDSPKATVRFSGKGAALVVPTGFQALRAAEVLQAAWDDPGLDEAGQSLALALRHYELRRGSDWRAALKVAETTHEAATIDNWAPVRQHLLLRAVDKTTQTLSGTAVAYLDLAPPTGANVVLDHDAVLTGWPSAAKIVVSVAANGRLQLIAGQRAGFYFSDRFDLGESREWDIRAACDIVQQQLGFTGTAKRLPISGIVEGPFLVGQQVDGLTSGALGIVRREAHLGATQLILDGVTGTFQAAERVGVANGAEAVCGGVAAALVGTDAELAARDFGGPFDVDKLTDTLALNGPIRSRFALVYSDDAFNLSVEHVTQFMRVKARYLYFIVYLASDDPVNWGALCESCRVVVSKPAAVPVGIPNGQGGMLWAA